MAQRALVEQRVARGDIARREQPSPSARHRREDQAVASRREPLANQGLELERHGADDGVDDGADDGYY